MLSVCSPSSSYADCQVVAKHLMSELQSLSNDVLNTMIRRDEFQPIFSAYTETSATVDGDGASDGAHSSPRATISRLKRTNSVSSNSGQKHNKKALGIYFNPILQI